MTRTSNSSPDGTRATREETEDGEELVSSTSEGRCLAEVNDGDGPMDDAEEISAFVGRQERAECEMRNDPQPSSSISAAVDVEGGASTSSASAGLCLADDDDGPINIAEISATLEQQDRAEKAEAQRINSQTSSAAIPPPRRESSGSSFSPSLRESSASLVQISLAETNLAVSAQELTIPPTDGDGRDTSAQRALSMESAGVASVPSSIMAEAYTVPDTPVFTASIVEVMPWYKQRRNMCILLIVLVVGAVAAVVGGVVGDRNKSTTTTMLVQKLTSQPTMTSVPSSMPSITSSPTAAVCGVTVLQPVILDGSHDCDCTDSPAVVVMGTGVEFNLNSFTVACMAGSQPVIVVDGISNSVRGRLRDQALGGGNGAKGSIVGSQSTQTRIQLRGSGNHTVQDLAICLADARARPVDQVGVQIESSGNTVDSCNIDSPSLSNPLSHPGKQIGIRVNGDMNTLSSNYISVQNDGSRNYGIQSSGDNCLIIGNVISEGYGGILLEWGSCQVLGNAISAQQHAALEVTGGTHTLSGNTITKSNFGIALTSNSGPESVIDNNTISFTEVGIYCEDAIFFLSNNIIRDITADGIRLLRSSFSSISGNAIQNCGDDAIDLLGSSNVTVVDNTLVNSKYGVGSVNASSLAISNNSIRNIKNDGIHIENAALSSISGNSINNCESDAISIWVSSHVAVRNNIISNASINGIQLVNAALSSIRGNSIQICGDDAISLFYSSNVTVTDNTLEYSEWGIYSEDSTSLAMRNNTMREMKEDGIQLKDAALSSIIGNSIQICGDDAIYLSSSSDVTVKDNALVNSYWGINSDDSTSLTISNNTISDMKDDGIHLKSSTSSSISGNSIQICSDVAIDVSSSSDVTVVDNALVNCAWGIYSKDSTSLAISNNTVSDMKDDGIQLESPTSSSINGNSINNCEAISLFDSSDVTVEDNTLVQIMYGIYSKNATSLDISNNNISNASIDGIYLKDADLSSISGNSIQNCEDSAIYLQDSTHITIQDNALVEIVDGIYSGNTTSLVVSNNTIGYASSDGFGLESSAFSSINGNLIQNCGDNAIALWDSSHITVTDNTLVDSILGVWSNNATSLAIRNNTISDNSHIGIELWITSSTDVRGNIVNNNGGVGIHLLEIGLDISNIENYSEMVGGFHLLESGLDTKIVNNTVNGNGGGGMIITASDETLIAGNMLDSNKGPGIFLVGIRLLDIGLDIGLDISNIVNYSEAVDTKIVNNTVNGNYGGGIIITASDETLITGNMLDSNRGPGISLCAEMQEFEEYFEGANNGANNELIDNVITASTNAAQIHIGEGCVGTVLKGNMAADSEGDQLLIDNESPTTLISSDNVPNFAFTLVGPGHCQDSLSRLYDFATFELENTTLADCEATCGYFDITNNLVGFEISRLACICLFENDFLSSEIPGTLGTCPSSANVCSITGTEGSGAVSSSLLPAEEDRYCYKKANYVNFDKAT